MMFLRDAPSCTYGGYTNGDTSRGCAKTWVLAVLVLGMGLMMLLYCANRLLGEPVLVAGGELVVVVEASFELGLGGWVVCRGGGRLG